MTAPRVVVAGAINTDLVAVVKRAPVAGETVTGASFHVFGGGKGANQAVAARRAGANVALVGAVGDDGFGTDRRADLAGDGVDLDGVRTIPGMASGVALITVEQEGENRIAYVPGPTLRIDGDQVRRVVTRHAPVVWLQPNEIPKEASLVGLETARGCGAITVLNAAPDPETVVPLLGLVDVLIVNEGEAAALLGDMAPPGEMAEALARKVDTDVVLTAGAKGAFGFRAGRLVTAPAPIVEVVDTTGAGDTFCGAFATRLARGDTFAEAIAWAVVAGSLATTVAGAQPSIPMAAAVDAFIARR